MKQLAREILVQRDDIEAAFNDTLLDLHAGLYDKSAQLAEQAIGEHDVNYLTLRAHIEAVLKQALYEGCDPIDELIELCDQ